jgi:hypothetical protein
MKREIRVQCNDHVARAFRETGSERRSEPTVSLMLGHDRSRKFSLQRFHRGQRAVFGAVVHQNQLNRIEKRRQRRNDFGLETIEIGRLVIAGDDDAEFAQAVTLERRSIVLPITGARPIE